MPGHSPGPVRDVGGPMDQPGVYHHCHRVDDACRWLSAFLRDEPAWEARLRAWIDLDSDRASCGTDPRANRGRGATVGIRVLATLRACAAKERSPLGHAGAAGAARQV